MGLHCTEYLSYDKEIKFDYQNILDNVGLVDDSLVEEVNKIVEERGHQLLKRRRKRL